MRLRWLLLLAVVPMLASVAAVSAAPDGPSGVPAAFTGSVDPSAAMPQVLRHNYTRDELRDLQMPVLDGRVKDWSLQQALWTGLIDDFEEGTEPSVYRGWQLNQDLNKQLFGEYKWGVRDCRASHGRKSLWAIGDGADGRLLGCNSPYPNGVNSSIWLALDLTHWPTTTQQLDLMTDFWLNLRTQVESNVEPDGLFVSYMMPTTVGEEQYEHVVIAAVTAKNPSSFWYQPLVINLLNAEEVYDPDNDGVKRTFNLAGKSPVYIEFMFVSGQKTTERFEDGVYIDYVRLVSNVPGPNVTVPPPTVETPTETPSSVVPTFTPDVTAPPVTTEPATATPVSPPTTPPPTTVPSGDYWLYLPVGYKNAETAPDAPATSVPTTQPEPTETEGPTVVPPPTDLPPTDEPTPEPTALPPGCREILVNGGFEQGPSVGWTLETNAQNQDGVPLGLADVILNNDAFAVDPAVEGEWFALLGRAPSVRMALYQKDLVPLVDPQTPVTATLRFFFAQITDEVPDGNHDDQFAVFMLNEADDREQLGGGISEENADFRPGMVYELSIDVSTAITRRAGWDTMRLLFYSEQNDAVATMHLIDGASLTVCEGVPPLAVRRGVDRPERMTVRPIAPVARGGMLR